jgi:Sulfotransferase family
MGIADSPLQDRVLFVEATPRSGTSWLITLLAAHPDVAGIASESHLFDQGLVSLFDSHERPPWGPTLSAFVSEGQLADLVRDLCDGALLAVRDRVKPQASWVAEKSPLLGAGARATLERKLRCFPDAWYLHLVREEKDVIRSFLRSRFGHGWERPAVGSSVRDARAAIRDVLHNHPRYRELTYEDLCADPGLALSDVLGWLGLRYDEEVADCVRTLSRERYARDAPRRSAGSRGAGMATVRRLGGRLRQLASGGRVRERGRGVTTPSAGARLVEALKSADDGRLRESTTEDLELELRTPGGDVRASGDEARTILAQVGKLVFGGPFVTVDWHAADGSPFGSFLFQGMTGDTRRVDVSFHWFPHGDRVTRLIVVSAGDLGGRPLEDWRAEPQIVHR